MGKLPKKYIKQYGISKKAWKMYRASLGKKTGNPGKKTGNPGKKTGNPGKKVRSRKTVAKKKKGNKSRGLGPEINHLLGSLGSYLGEEVEVRQIRPRMIKFDKTPEENKKEALMAGIADAAIGYGVRRLGHKARLPRSLVDGFGFTLGGKGIGLVKYHFTGWGGLFKPKEDE